MPSVHLVVGRRNPIIGINDDAPRPGKPRKSLPCTGIRVASNPPLRNRHRFASVELADQRTSDSQRGLHRGEFILRRDIDPWIDTAIRRRRQPVIHTRQNISIVCCMRRPSPTHLMPPMGIALACRARHDACPALDFTMSLPPGVFPGSSLMPRRAASRIPSWARIS